MNFTNNNIFFYVGIFCIIFFPYLFAQMFVKKEKMDAARRAQAAALPLLYSKTYWLLLPFSVTIGKIYANAFPSEWEKTQKKLIVANIKMPVEFVITAQTIGALFCFIAVFYAVIFLLSEPWFAVIGAVIAAFVGWMYPKIIVDNTAQSRQTSIIRSLPFAIDLLASAMRSGLDFSASIRYYVANENRGSALAQEFTQALCDMELGKTRIEALEDMSVKIQMDEFTSFVSAVIHGTEVGASIVETLKIQGSEMRRGRFNTAERKAARAPSLMILPIALFIMPAFFLVIAAPIFIKMQNTGGLGAILK